MKKSLLATVLMASAAVAVYLINDEKGAKVNKGQRRAIKVRSKEENDELLRTIQEIENLPSNGSKRFSFDVEELQQNEDEDILEGISLNPIHTTEQEEKSEVLETFELENIEFNDEIIPSIEDMSEEVNLDQTEKEGSVSDNDFKSVINEEIVTNEEVIDETETKEEVVNEKAIHEDVLNEELINETAVEEPEELEEIEISESDGEKIDFSAFLKNVEENEEELVEPIIADIIEEDLPITDEDFRKMFESDDEVEELEEISLDEIEIEESSESLEEAVFNQEEEKEDEFSETIKEIGLLYPYLNQGFIGKILQQLPHFTEEFKNGDTCRIVHKVQFHESNNLMRFLEIIRGQGYEVVGTDANNNILLQLDFVTQESKILSEIYNISNQVNYLDGIYRGYELEAV